MHDILVSYNVSRNETTSPAPNNMSGTLLLEIRTLFIFVLQVWFGWSTITTKASLLAVTLCIANSAHFFH